MTNPVETLWRQKEKFLAFLQSRLSQKEAAQDLLHTALLKIVEHPEHLPQEDRLVPWFYQVLRNAVIDFYRKKQAEERASKECSKEEPPPYKDPSLPSNLCPCMDGLLSALPSQYAAILKTVDLEEQPLKQYANVQGITSNGALVRLHRARKTLGKRLRQFCGTCAEERCQDCSCRPPPISSQDKVGRAKN